MAYNCRPEGIPHSRLDCGVVHTRFVLPSVVNMDRFWDDDTIRTSDGRIGRITRVGWDEDQANLEPTVRAPFAPLSIFLFLFSF